MDCVHVLALLVVPFAKKTVPGIATLRDMASTARPFRRVQKTCKMHLDIATYLYRTCPRWLPLYRSDLVPKQVPSERPRRIVGCFLPSPSFVLWRHRARITRSGGGWHETTLNRFRGFAVHVQLTAGSRYVHSRMQTSWSYLVYCLPFFGAYSCKLPYQTFFVFSRLLTSLSSFAGDGYRRRKPGVCYGCFGFARPWR